MIKLVQTCFACPEQYDAFNEAGEVVGYLRLRWGTFKVVCPNVGGIIVYQADTAGHGCFDEEERDYYLRFAVDAIEKYLVGKTPIRSEAPDVQYTIVSYKEI